MTYISISSSNSKVNVHCKASAQPLTSDSTAAFTAQFGKNETTRVETIHRRKSSQSTARGLELVIQLPIVTRLVLCLLVLKSSKGRKGAELSSKYITCHLLSRAFPFVLQIQRPNKLVCEPMCTMSVTARMSPEANNKWILA
ncbi:hypothetical protein PHYBLDRAFT_138770 [Phycomyces blakesleeanus NRRL 1555(-)]|uniref:Uncharacterized protein n=1 Tax=Phycomyces blakesleeanus (strain ATCC 8743b / DSM 1359 / FGSC 10004 / NBRC 33097 / NRRL 1555) TaxID=763407 RepID=A0A163BFA2_PHYB8|nr:hypothetical protein PHYBLDRAFT_138770 [Phycomyces blakesleeanus NRRL 1555(-)]OAD81221.1 hypothetical protein PHYBLDRAFT_138770 [Phycomyces blakesleeanus NRRL 1555(-)]|eukprot:XP_018299261.1 hypothetical protein PHYBLDRAFT_138770 [Phycomyces blakesleeanus NRRL 1555(-)]